MGEKGHVAAMWSSQLARQGLFLASSGGRWYSAVPSLHALTDGAPWRKVSTVVTPADRTGGAEARHSRRRHDKDACVDAFFGSVRPLPPQGGRTRGAGVLIVVEWEF
jgi:hypothetical protein